MGKRYSLKGNMPWRYPLVVDISYKGLYRFLRLDTEIMGSGSLWISVTETLQDKVRSDHLCRSEEIGRFWRTRKHVPAEKNRKQARYSIAVYPGSLQGACGRTAASGQRERSFQRERRPFPAGFGCRKLTIWISEKTTGPRVEPEPAVL